MRTGSIPVPGAQSSSGSSTVKSARSRTSSPYSASVSAALVRVCSATSPVCSPASSAAQSDSAGAHRLHLERELVTEPAFQRLLLVQLLEQGEQLHRVGHPHQRRAAEAEALVLFVVVILIVRARQLHLDLELHGGGGDEGDRDLFSPDVLAFCACTSLGCVLLVARRGGAGSSAGPTGSGARLRRSGDGAPRQGRMHRDPVSKSVNVSGSPFRADDTPARQPSTT